MPCNIFQEWTSLESFFSIFSSQKSIEISNKKPFFSQKYGFLSILIKFKYFFGNIWYKFCLIYIFGALICIPTPITTHNFCKFGINVWKIVRKTDILELSQLRPSKGVMHGWMWSNIDWRSFKIFYEYESNHFRGLWIL